MPVIGGVDGEFLRFPHDRQRAVGLDECAGARRKHENPRAVAQRQHQRQLRAIDEKAAANCRLPGCTKVARHRQPRGGARRSCRSRHWCRCWRSRRADRWRWQERTRCRAEPAVQFFRCVVATPARALAPRKMSSATNRALSGHHRRRSCPACRRKLAEHALPYCRAHLSGRFGEPANGLRDLASRGCRLPGKSRYASSVAVFIVFLPRRTAQGVGMRPARGGSNK